MKSSILLVCFTPVKNSPVANEYQIYKIFKEHVIVKNVRVFSREKQVKAFILLEDQESINRAISELHQKNSEIGKLTVYQSHKKYIAFEKSLHTIIEENLPVDKKLSQDGKKTFSQKEIDYLISKKSSQQTLDSWRNKNDSGNLFGRVKKSGVGDFTRKKSQLGFDLVNREKSLDISDLSFKDQTKNLCKEFKEKPKRKKTKFLKVKGFDFNRCNHINIFNFFGCFGNVIRLLMDREQKRLILEIQDPVQTTYIKQNTDQAIFFGNPLKTSFFFDSEIFSKNEKNPKIKIINNHERFYRFKKNLSIKVNTPTKLLHVTHLAERVTPVILYQLVSQICDPVNIFKLARKGSSSDMYIVEFEGVEETIKVLSILHNKKVDGKPIKISFSHTELKE